jgi:hypothetical protein
LCLSQLDKIAGLAGRQKRRKFKRMRRITAEKHGGNAEFEEIK